MGEKGKKKKKKKKSPWEKKGLITNFAQPSEIELTNCRGEGGGRKKRKIRKKNYGARGEL